jgi:hypothetical protein
MLLQQRCGDLLGDIAFYRLLNDGRLHLSPGHQDNPFGLEDGADSQRNGQARHMRDILKIVGIGDPGRVVQGNEAGAGVDAAAGLVKADMPVIADPQDLQVDATGIFDHFFIIQTVLFDVLLTPLPVGEMAIGRVDVDLVEQLLFHETIVALQRIVVDRVIFVEVKRDHILKAQLFVAVQSYQFGIQRLGRGTRGQTQDGLLSFCFLFTDQLCDLFSNRTGAFFQRSENIYRDFLERIYHAHSLEFFEFLRKIIPYSDM